MANEQYVYAVARIHSKELTLLDKQVLEQLLASKSHEECMRFLTDKGWGSSDYMSAEQMLSYEREKTWELMKELVEDMSIFNTFLYENDFHNLKASLKQYYTHKERPNVFMKNATVDPELINQAVKEHDFTLLPEFMRESAKEAYEVLMHTGDGQLCDVILDRAALDTLYQKASETKLALFQKYAELRIVAANINIAVRGLKTGKKNSFFQDAIAECETLDKNQLIEVILQGEQELYQYLETTIYVDAVQAIKESPSAFERWCDNVIMEEIKPQKNNHFSVEPLAAFILARESEIKSVRIILSGKLNNLSQDLIRERIREMYV